MPDPLSLATRGLFDATRVSLVTRGLIGGEGTMHLRTLIRRHVTKRLTDAMVTSDRVYAARILNFQKKDLPAIAVFTAEEPAEQWDAAPPTLKRELELVTEIYATGQDVSDQLDAIALVIEAVVGTDPYQGGFAIDTQLTHTKIEFDEDGARIFGSCALTWTVTYPTDVVVVAQDELKTLSVEWNVAVPDDQIDAEDILNLNP